jgi:hypothetical protein
MMKNRFFTVIVLLMLLVTLTSNAQATTQSIPAQPALVYVNLQKPDDINRFAATRLPIYAMLDGGLLTGADQKGQSLLDKSGLSYQVLDPVLGSGFYYTAQTWPNHPAPDYSAYGQVLFSQGDSVVLRMDPAGVDALTQAGAEVRLITLTPKPLPAAQTEEVTPAAVEPDPLIQGIIDQVSTTQVYTYDKQLAGELPVWVDGGWYTIPSRNTNSGTPIQKTTNYVGQHMANDLGLPVEYYQWSGPTNPDVIGQITGLVNPDDVFIIGAHIDDVNGTPGADDNASGSVATLLAADILSQYQWGCTLRFAFWTGEEQGLLGSAAYAQHVHNSGENIVGYLNLDMIAWNTIGSNPSIFLGYRSSVPGSLDLANLFSAVVTAYNIDLQPVIGTSYDGSSDHTSFLDQGYPAILGIEGDDDFNPYYHGSQDTPAHTDPTYFTDFVKASLATYAHMSNCLIPSGTGYLDGHVTAVDGGAPIEGATVTATDGLGHSFNTTTDATGYYTRTLLSDTYAVTADTYGYAPQTVEGVVVTTDTVTTQDFQLTALPTHVVSGYVYDSVSGDPLEGTVRFTDALVPPVNTSPDGFYSLTVAEGTWHILATSAAHQPQTQEVIVNNDLTVDFLLDPLPCILLVDDDNDSPDTAPDYTAALDSMGLDYNIFDTNGGGGPDLAGLQGYRMVLWFSGDTYGGTAGPNGTDEANLASYLDAGGKLFLDSQDYLYDMGLTSFGQNYLGVANFTSDTGDATSIVGLAGDPIGDGLGPYTLSYPSDFTDYGDIISAGPGASVSFKAVNNNNQLDIDKNGGDWQTAFFATSWVPIYNNNAANGQAVIQRVVDFFGGCQIIPDEPIQGLTAINDSPTDLGDPTTLTASVTGGTNVHYEWDFGDGNVGTGAVVEHVYAETGLYEASVHAYNDVSAADATTAVNIVAVSLAPVAQEKTGEPGMQVSYTFTVTNDAAVEQEVLLNVVSEWPTEAPSTVGVLGPGASATVPVIVTIPSMPNVIIGQDTFTLTATGGLGGVAEATGTTLANVTPGGTVTAPAGKSGMPLEVVSYDFVVTNTGDYTDTFSLGVTGIWTATLPGGDTTGPLAAGESITVTVLVTVPAEAVDGMTDVSTLTITSALDPDLTAAASVTTTASLHPPMYSIMLPLVNK